jgi:hypothetical protein
VAGAADQAVALVLLRLLVAIVAGLAQALQVVVVEEQAFVAAVRDHVVNHARFDVAPQLAAHAAQRLKRQLPRARPLPGGAVVEVAVV